MRKLLAVKRVKPSSGRNSWLSPAAAAAAAAASSVDCVTDSAKIDTKKRSSAHSDERTSYCRPTTDRSRRHVVVLQDDVFRCRIELRTSSHSEVCLSLKP